MTEIEWTKPAFASLESLPETLAFEIVERVDLLMSFPEIGSPLRSRFRALRNCRQLVINRWYRVIYEYDADAGIIYILAVQHCRQKLPTAGQLRSARRQTE